MADSWRLAKSLVVLRTEVRSRYPGTTFWTIGDAAHQSGWSDHNKNAADVVCAADVLGDGGMSLDEFVAHLVANPHPNLRYVIYKRRIYQRRNNFRPEYYDGSNPHNTHAHVSVGNGPDGRSTSGYDSTSSWGIANIGGGSVPSTGSTLREGDSGSGVERLQRDLNEAINAGLTVDGDYGPNTTAAVKALQRRAGITADGIYGPNTAEALRDLLEDDMAITEDDVRKFWRYTNDQITPRDAYAQLRQSDAEAAILAELAAARKREEAILAAVKGVDTKTILTAIQKAALEDAARDTAAADALAEIAALVAKVGSGEIAADQVVDAIADRLARVE